MKIYEVRRNYECEECTGGDDLIRAFRFADVAELFLERYRRTDEGRWGDLAVVEVDVEDDAPELIDFYTVSYVVKPDRRTFSAIQAGVIHEVRTPPGKGQAWSDQLPAMGIFERKSSRLIHAATARALTAEEADRLMDEHISLRDNGAFE